MTTPEPDGAQHTSFGHGQSNDMAKQETAGAEIRLYVDPEDTGQRDGEADLLEAEQKGGDQRQPPPDKVLDVKSFLETVGDRPVFTRNLLERAASQLKCVQNGTAITLTDCYGDLRTIDIKDGLEVDKEPELIYNNQHILADDDPYNILRQLDPETQHSIVHRFGDDVEEMIEYSRFPVYVHFREKEDAQDYDLDLMIENLGYGMVFWDQSVEHKLLQGCLRELSNTARITNIVCIAHGGLGRGAASILQHVAASSIAQELTALYKKAGQPLENPLTIIAQDPAYTTNDVDLLGRFPIPIRVVPDPESFLAINDTSLVMACYPTVPVKQMVADLAADSTTGKGPAAVLWNNNWWEDNHGGVDIVTYSWMEVVYFANPGSRRLLNMLQGYEKIMDGSGMFSHLQQAEAKQGDEEEDVADCLVADEGLSQGLKDLSLQGVGDKGGSKDLNNGSEDPLIRVVGPRRARPSPPTANFCRFLQALNGSKTWKFGLGERRVKHTIRRDLHH